MIEGSNIEGQGDALGLYGSARLSFSRMEYEEAMRLLTKSIEISPHFKAFELLGVCFQHVGDVPSALACFKEAHQLNPKSSKTAFLYALTLHDSGDSESARAILDALLRHDMNYGPAMELMKRLGASWRPG